MPRFGGDNRAQNQKLIEALGSLAQKRGATGPQLAVAWVLARSKNLIPTLGARTRAQLRETLGALQVKLTPADLAEIEKACPVGSVAGSRYDERQMRALDSEKE
jgi:aryl-alcohol dehydrogenase-like predicted oxidoreductase